MDSFSPDSSRLATVGMPTHYECARDGHWRAVPHDYLRRGCPPDMLFRFTEHLRSGSWHSNSQGEVMMDGDVKHNNKVLLLVAFVCALCVLCYSWLSIHGKPEAALLTIAGSSLGILTGSAFNQKKPETTTSIPDSTGTINVNIPAKEEIKNA